MPSASQPKRLRESKHGIGIRDCEVDHTKATQNGPAIYIPLIFGHVADHSAVIVDTDEGIKKSYAVVLFRCTFDLAELSRTSGERCRPGRCPAVIATCRDAYAAVAKSLEDLQRKISEFVAQLDMALVFLCLHRFAAPAGRRNAHRRTGYYVSPRLRRFGRLICRPEIEFAQGDFDEPEDFR
ncbi:hypothetical protein SBC1_72360 (plasmid) [Caballeronia sp. SBC1]|nr:hypothetical protein SBC2_74520 [Caballeronia sp. SBC2]QIN67189.1 hypothetical protein SBC1_72360 [Caballeronia sp. SBC1]